MKNLLKLSEVTDAGRSPRALYIESDKEKNGDTYFSPGYCAIYLIILTQVIFKFFIARLF